MPTRHKRPSIIKQLGISMLLSGFMVYMGHSAISGKYGIESAGQMSREIQELKSKSDRLQIELDALGQRISLFDPERLDPDILSERARKLLAMAHKDDRIVLIATGKE